MTDQFRTSKDAKYSVPPAAQGRIVCVKIGKYGSAQGNIVWERNGLVCVQAFSKQFIGERV